MGFLRNCLLGSISIFAFGMPAGLLGKCPPAIVQLGLSRIQAEAHVAQTIEERTEAFGWQRPELKRSDGGRQSAARGIERPFLKEIFQMVKQEARKSFQDLASRWATAYHTRLRFEQESRDEQYKKIKSEKEALQTFYAQISSARQSLLDRVGPSGPAYQSNRSRLEHLERQEKSFEAQIRNLDAQLQRWETQYKDGLPDTPFFRRHREATRFLGLELAAAKKGPRSPADLGSTELQRRVAQIAISGAFIVFENEAKAEEASKDFTQVHQKGNRLIFPGLLDRFFSDFERLAEALFSVIELEFENEHFDVRWDRLADFAKEQLLQLKRRLEQEFPLTVSDHVWPKDGQHAEALESELRKIKQMVQAVDMEGILPQWVNGGLEFRVSNGGVARYEPEIGTMILFSDKGMLSQPGPIYVLLHGDGTTQSNAGSWRSLMSMFKHVNGNAIAVALPNSGPMQSISTDLHGMEANSAFLQRVYEFIRRHDKQNRPIIVLGRSAGSTKAYIHSLLYELVYPDLEGGPVNQPVDAMVLTSLSNPLTTAEQIKSVYEQAEAGLFEVVEQSLNGFNHMVEDVLQLLESVPEEERAYFAAALGDRILILQGVSDEDGGPDVVKKLKEFVDQYSPYSHVLIYENPLLDPKKYPELIHADGSINYSRINPDLMEATHFLLSSHDDMTLKDWQRLYPDIKIDAADIPKLRTQTFQTLAATYLHMDYLADSSPFRLEGRGLEAAERIREHRKKLTKGEGSFLDWFLQLKNVNIAPEDYQAAEPSMRGTLAERIRAIELFFQERAQALN